ncbi:MAG: hypothetical protein Q7T94_03480 [Rugosibacter sp.]|nr:hypothetical protein [Rugosibacter sp.]
MKLSNKPQSKRFYSALSGYSLNAEVESRLSPIGKRDGIEKVGASKTAPQAMSSLGTSAGYAVGARKIKISPIFVLSLECMNE